MSSKSRACEAAFCDEKEKHLFLWPAKAEVAAKWTDFVRLKRANFTPDRHSRLCYKHFTDQHFTNAGMYRQGFVSM